MIIEVEGALNVRDLGGLPLETGGTTRFRRLVRADGPHRLTDAGRAAVAAHGVRHVVDLRTDEERSRRPSRLVDLPGVSVVTASLIDSADATLLPPGLLTATDVYRWWLEAQRERVARALAAIADAAEPAVLVHCHAGKDRTGVVVALILRLSGVTLDSIAADFALTGVHLAGVLQAARETALARGDDPALADRFTVVERATILDTLQSVETDHGSVEAFLRGLGLGEPRVERLSSLLVADRWPPA